jgi:regulator of replication initiation timing
LEIFSKQKSKVITISDLQHEISNIKKEIVDLKNDMHHIKLNNQDLKGQILISNLHKKFQDNNEDLKIEEITGNQHEHSNDPESSNAIVCSSSTLKFVKLVKSFTTQMVCQNYCYCCRGLFLRCYCFD